MTTAQETKPYAPESAKPLAFGSTVGLGVKPEFGASCNRCGICCQTRPCVAGRYIFGDIDGQVCPALVDVGCGTECGVMTDPSRFGASTNLARCMRSGLSGRCDFDA